MESKPLFVARPRAVLFAAAWLATGAGAFGQSLFSTSANIIATNGDAIPGGAVGETFGGSSTFDTGVLADDGKIFFRGRILGSTVPTERAYFWGDSRTGLQMVVRGGDPEPSGTLPGVTLLSSTGTSSGLGSSVRVSANGTMLWSTSLFGTGSTANDTAYYIGTPGNFSIWIREGDVAPGTVGATFSSSFSSLSTQQSGVNNAGVAWVLSNLSGGDVVGTTNSEGLFTGPAGALVLAARRGDLGPNGQIVADIAPSFIGQMNDSGQIVFDVSYVIGSGSPAVSTLDDRALWIYTPGVGSQELICENDPVTGFPGLTYSGTSGSPFTAGASNFSNAGVFCSRVSVGGGAPAIAKFTLAGDTIVVQGGDPVPGIPGGATFDVFNDASVTMNNNGDVCFQAAFSGPGVLATDDSGAFTTKGGSVQLVVREGDLGPGTTWTFGTVTSFSIMQNGAGQILFNNSMTTGGTPVSTYWGWTQGAGLQLIVAGGDSIEVQPGVFKSATTSGGIQFTNCNGRPLTFHDDGRISHRLSFNDGTSANLTVLYNPTIPPVAYCTAGTSSNGCVPVITGTGTPSVAASSGFTIGVANVEGAKLGLIFYGINGRASATWGAGGNSFFCVKAPTQRMGSQNSGGTAGACDGSLSEDWLAYLAANPGSLGSPFSAGATVNAQAWYRDPPAVKTTNLSGGLEFVTVP